MPAVHRIGAVAVAAGHRRLRLLGLADGLDYFSTDGERIAGLSSNGLLSTISLVTAAVLIAAALRGSRVASTVMLVIGVLFLVSALANLAVLETSLNVLAFSMANVDLLDRAPAWCCSARRVRPGQRQPPARQPLPTPRGRAGTSRRPASSSPRPRPSGPRSAPCATPSSPSSSTGATADQQRRVAAMAQVRTRADRREVWMSFDRTPELRG